jgi:hypothetical protein
LVDINNQIGIGVGPSPAMAGAVSFKPRFYETPDGPLAKQGYVKWDKNTPKPAPLPAPPAPTPKPIVAKTKKTKTGLSRFLPTSNHVIWGVLIIVCTAVIALAIINLRKKRK